MPATPPHSKLLTQAARAVLQPMGLVQKGRSRTWLDDRGWWLCVVYFQPSSWSNGSYLNVGPMWLWEDHDFVYFAEGGRVEDAPFVEFESVEQFAPEAAEFAGTAAREVERYRARYANLGRTASYLEEPEGYRGNPHDDALGAAIAWGLLGQTASARRNLDKHDQIVAGYLKSWETEDWFVIDEAHYRDEAASDYARAERLRGLLEDRSAFRSAITGDIKRYREALRLPDLDPFEYEQL